MTTKRIFDFPLATEWDSAAFFPQDKSGGVTQRVSPALVETKLQADGFPKISSPSVDEVAVYGAGGWDAIKLMDANIATGAAIAWSKISKSGAVASDVGALPVDSPSWTSELSGSQMTMGSYRVRAGDSATPVGDGDIVICSASRIRGWLELKWSTSNREETVFAYVAAGQFDVSGASIQILGRYSYQNHGSISGLKLMLSSDSATVYLVATLANRNSGLLPISCLYSGTDPVVYGGSMPAGGSTIKALTLGAGGISISSLVAQDLAGTGSRNNYVDASGNFVSSVPIPKPDLFHASWDTDSTTYGDIVNWTDSLVNSAHYRCAVFGSITSSTATYTSFRFIIGGVSGADIVIDSKGDYSVTFDVTSIGGNPTVCANVQVYGSSQVVTQSFSGCSFSNPYGIRVQIKSDDASASVRGKCSRLERLQ